MNIIPTKPLYLFLILAGLTVFASNCSKINIDNPVITKNQLIIFQMEYINAAWGYQHNGYLIDSSGNVYTYSLPKKWTFCDSTRSLSETDMLSNLSETDSISYKIDKQELHAKLLLLGPALKGTLSAPRHEMCDAGIASFNVYTYDAARTMYKQILLKQWGDIMIDNSSPAADSICAWMNKIEIATRHY